MPALLKNSTVALLCAIIVLWLAGPVLMQPSWYYNHDSWYPYRAAEFSAAFKEGFWYPRWMSGMLGGNGYPTFLYYQPGYFFLVTPFTYVTDVVTACKLAIFVLLFGGMMGAYFLARLWHPRWLALCFAVVFIFSRYVVTNLSIRGDLSELMAMMIFPWNLYFLFRLMQHDKRRLAFAAGFALSAALISISHPLVAALWLPFVAGLLMFLTLPVKRDWRGFITGALCLAIAATISAPYWFTVLQMKDLVHIENAPTSFQEFLDNFNIAFHLLDNKNQSVYFVQEYWYFFAALIGFCLAWRQWPMVFAGVVYIAYSLMMTDYAIPLWKAGWDMFRYLQFDWRFLAPVVTIRYLGILLLGVPLMKLYTKNKDGARLAVLIAIGFTGLVVAAEKTRFDLDWPLKGGSALYPLEYEETVAKIEKEMLIYANGKNEFLPKTAVYAALNNRIADKLAIATLPQEEGTVKQLSSEGSGIIQLRVTALKETHILLHQLYFPGWKLLVNGKEEIAKPTPEGLMQLQLKAGGPHEITAWYDGPPHWQLRNLVIAFLLVSETALLWRMAQKS